MLLNLIKLQRPDIDKIYLYVKDPFESKYQLLINGREKVEVKKLKNAKAFSDHPQIIDDCFWKFRRLQSNKEKKILKVFDDMIPDTEANKKLSSIVTELLLRGRKPNILLVFISQFYIKVSETIRLNATD